MLKIYLTLMALKYHGRKMLNGFQITFCGDWAPEWPSGNNGVSRKGGYYDVGVLAGMLHAGRNT